MHKEILEEIGEEIDRLKKEGKKREYDIAETHLRSELRTLRSM